MRDKVKCMLEKHAIETTPRGRSFESRVFLVPKKDGGRRPVMNLKPLNRFVHTEHFKMEGIHVLKDLLKAGDWMVKVDLKDAYFMLPIREEDRAFLKFSFQDRTYQFNCLPFGLACAPWVFTKTLKPVAALLRQLGVRFIVYIDNILILAESKEMARDRAIVLIYLLENLGFAVSRAKCQLEPTQTIEFLGFLVDSLRQELSLPQMKIKKIRTEIWALLGGRQIAIRKMSQLLGKLQVSTRAVPLAPLFFRKLQRALRRGLEQSDQDYSKQITLSTEEREELQWWLDHLTLWNGKSFLTEKPSIGPTGFPTDTGEVGSTGSGYVCLKTDHLAGQILQLEAGSRGRSPGCIQPRLDQSPGEGICQPPMEPCGQSVKQSSATENHAGSDSTSLEEPTLVPNPARVVDGLPTTPPTDLIIPTHTECMPGMVPQLAAWLISGDATRTRKFQKKAQSCSWFPGGKIITFV